MNLNEIWEKLDEQSFAAIHGSFIVNRLHRCGNLLIIRSGFMN